MQYTYAEACVLTGANVAYGAAREVALDDVNAAVREWGQQGFGRDEIVDYATDLLAFYSNGDVPQAPQAWQPDYNMDLVSTLAKHADHEGTYEGHRTGVTVIAGRAADLAEQIREYGTGDEGETLEMQAPLAELGEWLSARYGIPTDAMPRFNHPAGV